MYVRQKVDETDTPTTVLQLLLLRSDASVILLRSNMQKAREPETTFVCSSHESSVASPVGHTHMLREVSLGGTTKMDRRAWFFWRLHDLREASLASWVTKLSR